MQSVPIPTQGEYFAHPFISNSDLTKSNRNGVGYAQNIHEAFRFGTLVHAMILEPGKIDHIKRTVEGEEKNYSLEIFNTSLAMKRSFMQDEFCANLLKGCSKEVEIYNPNTKFEYNGKSFCLDTKRKYDLFDFVNNWGGDIKTTMSTTQEGFLKSVEALDYDRARVFYAAGSCAKRDIIIGVSKIAPHNIFKVYMSEGSAMWKKGADKMNKLAYEFWNKNLPF